VQENIAMTTTSSSSSFSTSSDGLTASGWTQQSMLSDLMQRKALLIGIGVVIGIVLLLSRRSAPEEKAARRLVRDWRHVDDPDDVRDLLGENVPPLVRPVLLTILSEVERQVHRGFRALEREIRHL
jgi:hypothetical protein